MLRSDARSIGRIERTGEREIERLDRAAGRTRSSVRIERTGLEILPDSNQVTKD